VRRLAHFLLLPLLWFAARAEDSLLHARRGQALLGPDVWSQVIRVENGGDTRVYPRTVHALVFELVGQLWFYCSADGTQSLSLYANRLAEDKAHLGPLLRAIEPGFTSWKVLPNAEIKPGPLRNGCFLESLAALRMRAGAGVELSEPRLLSYYVEVGSTQRGHTVLVYRQADRMVVFDPGRPEKDILLPARTAESAVALARALDRPDIAKARFLAISPVVESAGSQRLG
jgi:hypothetical protein